MIPLLAMQLAADNADAADKRGAASISIRRRIVTLTILQRNSQPGVSPRGCAFYNRVSQSVIRFSF
jgi:hypothetical protein